MLFLLDHPGRIEGPGDDGLPSMVKGQEVLYICRLGLELQDGIFLGSEKRDCLCGEPDDMIEYQAVAELTGAEPVKTVRLPGDDVLDLVKDPGEIRLNGHARVVQVALEDTV